MTGAQTTAERVADAYPASRLSMAQTRAAHVLARSLDGRRVDIPTHAIYEFPDGSLVMIMCGRKIKASKAKERTSK